MFCQFAVDTPSVRVNGARTDILVLGGHAENSFHSITMAARMLMQQFLNQIVD